MGQRTCSIEGCDRAHRARGFCIAHYKQMVGGGYRKIAVLCDHCGEPCEKYARSSPRYVGQFCSLLCRDEHRRADTYRKRTLPVLWQRKPIRQPAVSAKRRLWTAGECRICSTWFVSRWSQTTCSDTCAEVKRLADRREYKQRRRARQRGAFTAPVFRIKIYKRDRWRCGICNKPVRRDVVAPHPLAPTLDHIIALASGGTHEPANVRCAHFICNTRRGAQIDTVQLALLG